MLKTAVPPGEADVDRAYDPFAEGTRAPTQLTGLKRSSAEASFPRNAGASAALLTGASGHQSGCGLGTIALACKALAQRWWLEGQARVRGGPAPTAKTVWLAAVCRMAKAAELSPPWSRLNVPLCASGAPVGDRCRCRGRGGVCCGRSRGGPACRIGRGRGWRRCGEGRCGFRSRCAVALLV